MTQDKPKLDLMPAQTKSSINCPYFDGKVVCPIPHNECPCPGRKMRVNTILSSETEAKRWAMELHDGIIPLIGNLQFDLEHSIDMVPPESKDLFQNLLLVREEVRAIYQEIRDMCIELRPSLRGDNKSLLATFHSYIIKFCTNNKLRYSIYFPDSIDGEIHPFFEIAIFRVLQECLLNIKKHSNATEVVVSLDADSKRCTLTVIDNGCGFDAAKLDSNLLLGAGKFGLINMRERASILGAVLNIDSSPGEYTKVRLVVPWIGRKGSDIACFPEQTK